MEEIIRTKIRVFALKSFFGLAVFFGIVFGTSNYAFAANLYFSPSSGTYSTGRNFTVNIRVESSSSMNAASGVVTFPTDKLEVLSVSKAGSIFNLWVQEPSFSNANSTGNVSFEGVVLNPGFTGDGKLISVTFRAKTSGQASLNLSSGSALANDGLGTNILSNLGTADFSLEVRAIQAPEVIEAPSRLPPKPLLKHFVKSKEGELILSLDSESPEKWISSRFNKLVWQIPSGVTGISVLLHDKPSANPGPKSDGFFDNKFYENLSDGIHYFHIRYINALGAGPILHFKIMVDTVPPEPFELILPDGEITSNPQPRIRFETFDALSGLDGYQMKIGDGDWFDASQLKVASYVLPKQAPGEHLTVVRAYDKAGNFAEARKTLIISPIAAPKITEYPINIISPGENLVLTGTALPGATVEIWLNKRGQAPIIFNVQTDEKGNWQAVYQNIIPSGAYEVWAKQTLENGAESLHSNSVYIGVNSWFWRAWQWLKNIGGIIVLGLILLAILAAAIYYSWHRFKLWRMKLKKEIREAEDAVASGFQKLKKEIKEGKTTSKILEDLSEIKKDIEKEIKDIKK